MRRSISWLILAVLAFSVGALFRLADVSGVALFRMFGFIGVATMGITVTMLITSLQMNSGRSELAQSILALPRVRVYSLPQSLPLPRYVQAEALLERDGTYYVISSTTLPNFRARRYRKRVLEAVQALSSIGRSDDGIPLKHVLVLLRRRVREDERRVATSLGVILVNPENLADALS